MEQIIALPGLSQDPAMFYDVQARPDMSCLSPAGLADYHFAVAAIQMDGDDVFLSTTAHEMAAKQIEVTHHDLLVAGVDAITKEILPGGGTISDTDDPSYDEPVTSIVHEPLLRDRYVQFLPADTPRTWPHIKQNPAVLDMVFAMRSAVASNSGDHETVRIIAADTARLAKAYFTRQDEKVEAAAAAANRNYKTPERGWIEFTGLVENLATAAHEPLSSESLIAATLVINAVHDQQRTILERFTDAYGPKAAQFRDVLDAAHEANPGRLRNLSGYLGGLLHEYITGRKKSLARLPSDRPVPPQFTHLS